MRGGRQMSTNEDDRIDLGYPTNPESANPPGSQFAGIVHPEPATPTLSPQAAPAIPQPMRRPPVAYQPNEPGWWLATDGLWYPPESAPGNPTATNPLVSGT